MGTVYKVCEQNGQREFPAASKIDVELPALLEKIKRLLPGKTAEPHLWSIDPLKKKFKLTPSIQQGDYKIWKEQVKSALIMAKLAEGTRPSYQAHWKQWALFRDNQHKSPFLSGESLQARSADEDSLLDFVIFLAKVLSLRYGSINQKLFAIRHGHVAEGYPDPILNRTRLWAAMGGLKRLENPTKRKYPVTVKMLRWLQNFLRDGGEYNEFDGIILWGAICLAFFFLLRASEYLVQNKSWSRSRVVRGKDLQFKLNNELCEPEKAEELVVHITQSKTDQYNAGTIRNTFVTKDEICPVRALAEIQRIAPQRFQGEHSNDPLFLKNSGEAVRREEIQHLLELSAMAFGVNADRMGSHSLRIGGATALYHTVQDLEIVKRFGRWKSDAFHGYLWESHEPQRGLSEGMVRDESSLTVQ